MADSPGVREIKQRVFLRPIEHEELVKDISEHIKEDFSESVRRIVEHHHAQECEKPQIEPIKNASPLEDITENTSFLSKKENEEQNEEYKDSVMKPEKLHFFCKECQQSLLANIPKQKELNPFSVIVDDVEYVVEDVNQYEGESILSEYSSSKNTY